MFKSIFEKIIEHKKTTVFMISVTAIVVCLLWFLNRSPILQYAEVEHDTIAHIQKQLNRNENEKAFVRQLNDQPHSQETIISGNVNLNEFSESAMFIRGVLANSRVVINSKYQPTTMETEAQINFQLQRTSLLKADFYQNNTYSALILPFYNQAVGIKNDELGSWLRENNYKPVLQEVPNSFSINRFFTFDINPQLSLLKEVAKYDAKVEKNVTYQGNTYRRFTLNLTDDQANDLLQQLIDQLELKTNPLNQRSLEFLSNLRFPDGLTYEAYFNNDSVYHRQLTGSIKNQENERTFTLQMTTQLDSDRFDLESSFSLNGSNPIQIKFESEGQPTDNGYTINQAINVEKRSDRLLSLKWDSLYKDEQVLTDFRLYTPHYLPRIEGNIVKETNIDKKQSSQNYRLNLNIAGLETDLDIIQVTTLEDTVEINRIEVKDVQFLHKLSNEESLQLISKIQSLLINYFEQLLNRFNPF